MFDIQVQFLVARRPVTFDGFVDSILVEVLRRVRAEMQNLSQARLAEIALPAREENRKGIRPLAVSVDEAARRLIRRSASIRAFVHNCFAVAVAASRSGWQCQRTISGLLRDKCHKKCAMDFNWNRPNSRAASLPRCMRPRFRSNPLGDA